MVYVLLVCNSKRQFKSSTFRTPPPIVTYNRQNSRLFFLVIIRRYREGIPDPPLISHDLDFLHEALDKRSSFREFAIINKLTQVIHILSYYLRTRQVYHNEEW
jgi:hypothetical protein